MSGLFGCILLPRALLEPVIERDDPCSVYRGINPLDGKSSDQKPDCCAQFLRMKLVSKLERIGNGLELWQPSPYPRAIPFKVAPKLISEEMFFLRNNQLVRDTENYEV